MDEITYHKTTLDGPFGKGLVRLRLEVYVDEQKVPIEEELDQYDPDATHLVAVQNGEVIGTLRVVRLDETTSRIGRLAVAEPYRHKKIATRLMEQALEICREKGARRVVLDSQVTVVPFYEPFGFVTEGEVFVDAGIDHLRMVLTLE